MLKIRMKKPTLIKIMVAIMFVLLCRPISIYYFSQNESLNVIYTWLSRIATVIAVGLMLIYKKNSRGIIIGVISIYLSLLITTLYGAGSVRRLGMLAYPVMGLICLTIAESRTIKKMKDYINAISNTMFVLTFINLIFILLKHDMFGDAYFMGIKNQIAYALNIGMLVCFLDNYLHGYHMKFYIYIVMYFITLIRVASSASLVGAGGLAIFFMVPYIRKMVAKVDFRAILFGYVVLFVLLVFFSADILNWEPIRYMIVNVLGKNITLTNRTAIWASVIPKLAEHPIIGHGIQESSNLFYVHVSFLNRADFQGNYSAHNQLLQTLYEGGIFTMIFVFISFWHSGKNFSQCSDENLVAHVKMILIVTLIMMLAESPGWDTVLIILNFSVVLSDCSIEEHSKIMEKSNVTRKNISYCSYL